MALQVGRLAQLVRALASHARGHWFESSIAHHESVQLRAEVAERQTRCVQGAVSHEDVWVQIPPSAPTLVRLASAVEIADGVKSAMKMRL